MSQDDVSVPPPVEDSRFTIDPEFSTLFYQQTPAEYETLKEGIRKCGTCDPLRVWQEEKILIDGHHRNKVCQELGITPPIQEESLADRDEARKWILKNQLGRRNMSNFQRAVVALNYESIIAEMAKARQRAGGGAVREKSSEPGRTMDILAKMAGMSAPTLRQVKFILEHADQETINKLNSGDPDYSINGVFTTILESLDEGKGTKVGIRKSPLPQTPAPNPILAAIEKDIETQYPHAEGRLEFYDKMEKWVRSKKGDLIVFLAQYK